MRGREVQMRLLPDGDPSLFSLQNKKQMGATQNSILQQMAAGHAFIQEPLRYMCLHLLGSMGDVRKKKKRV